MDLQSRKLDDQGPSLVNNNTTSYTKIDEMNNLREKMQWYHSHKKEVLHYTHQHLVNFDVASIQRMSRSTMLEYIELLNTARIFYEKETSQLATNQSTIHSWIDKHSSIAQRVRSDPRQRNSTMSDSSHSDSTQECEFD